MKPCILKRHSKSEPGIYLESKSESADKALGTFITRFRKMGSTFQVKLLGKSNTNF